MNHPNAKKVHSKRMKNKDLNPSSIRSRLGLIPKEEIEARSKRMSEYNKNNKMTPKLISKIALAKKDKFKTQWGKIRKKEMAIENIFKFKKDLTEKERKPLMIKLKKLKEKRVSLKKN